MFSKTDFLSKCYRVPPLRLTRILAKDKETDQALFQVAENNLIKEI